MRALVRELPSPVADVEFGDVALFGKFEALLVREFVEAPEHAAGAGCPPMMESVDAALLFAVSQVEIILPAQRLNGLLENSLGFAGVILIGGNGRGVGLP